METNVICIEAKMGRCRFPECVHYLPHPPRDYGDGETCTKDAPCDDVQRLVSCKLITEN